jgi:hypothetical protein
MSSETNYNPLDEGKSFNQDATINWENTTDDTIELFNALIEEAQHGLRD